VNSNKNLIFRIS